MDFRKLIKAACKRWTRIDSQHYRHSGSALMPKQDLGLVHLQPGIAMGGLGRSRRRSISALDPSSTGIDVESY